MIDGRNNKLEEEHVGSRMRVRLATAFASVSCVWVLTPHNNKKNAIWEQ